MFSGIFPRTDPQFPHSFELGKKRSITTSSRPYQAHLYSSMDRSSVHEASEMARASAAWCAAILDFSTRAASQDGRELRLAPDDVLDLVVRATGDQLQTAGTRSQATR
ncbi:hypothetical protein ASD08_44305 [Streptomyces sp. Root369]|nr:hypothetical protein ASD08_44305 [Streptomyces sp. Root369]